VELNRDQPDGLKFWFDGKAIVAELSGKMPMENLDNTADFIVGTQAGEKAATWTIDMLRMARSTLAESRTSAEELYAWEMHGPQHADFTGARGASGQRRPPGALWP
jgi:hypothetical protein